MITQVSVIVEKDDIVMPDVNLSNVRALVDNLINYNGVGEMNFDEVANLSALLPAAARSLGIENQLTYESSNLNFKLAHEALSNNMKATLAAVLAAAIAIILKFFKMRKSSSYKKSGPDNTEPGTMSAAEAYRREFTKTSPLMEKQLDEFRAHMSYYANDIGLNALDGDIYPGLSAILPSLVSLTRQFTYQNVPEYQRSRDKMRMGEIYNNCAQALAPGKVVSRNFVPQNFLFRTDEENYKDTRFFDELFRFLRVNKTIQVTIPELTRELMGLRYQPTRVKDGDLPESVKVVEMIYNVIDNSFSPAEMARAVGINDIDRSDNIEIFTAIAEKLHQHVDSLCGTEVYRKAVDRGGADEFVEKRMEEYYDFLTKDVENKTGKMWLNVCAMADECGDILKIAEGEINNRNNNFLAVASTFTQDLQARYKSDMYNADKDSKNYNSQEINNYYDLKRIGIFITTLVRFLADLTRIVNSLSSFEERLGKVKAEMDALTKVLLQVNADLRKIKE